MCKTCVGCKYYAACGDIERTAPCNGKEIAETVIVNKREMPLLRNIRSIFDEQLGADFYNTGEYMILMRDCKGKQYAMTKQDWYITKTKGKQLEAGESAEFFGSKVRGMTSEEEAKWNHGEYDGLHIVDLWNNMNEE